MELNNNICEMLKKIEIFSSLTENSCHLIIAKMKREFFKAGEILCQEGEVGDKMFVIWQGEVEVTKNTEKGIEVPISILKAGEVAGVMSLFDKDIRSATLKAKTDCEVFVIDRQTMQTLLENNPQLARLLLAYLSSKLRAETQTVAQLLSQGYDSRFKIAFFDTKPYTSETFKSLNKEKYALHFFEPHLNLQTVALASGFQAVCAFVNDDLSAAVLEELAR